MSIDIKEYKNPDSPSWYNFPDGTNVQGRKNAQQYADELEELEGIAEEEAELDRQAEAADEGAGPDEEADENVVTSDDTTPEPLVAGKPDAEEKPVVDAADGDPDNTVTDNKNVPGERDQYLMEMTRQNRMFEYSGANKNYVFRHNAKILVVDAEDVQGLRDQGGFRVVTPQEAQEYYS